MFRNEISLVRNILLHLSTHGNSCQAHKAAQDCVNWLETPSNFRQRKKDTRVNFGSVKLFISARENWHLNRQTRLHEVPVSGKFPLLSCGVTYGAYNYYASELNESRSGYTYYS